MFHDVNSLDPRELWTCDYCHDSHRDIRHVGDDDIGFVCMFDYFLEKVDNLVEARGQNSRRYFEILATLKDVIFELESEE